MIEVLYAPNQYGGIDVYEVDFKKDVVYCNGELCDDFEDALDFVDNIDNYDSYYDIRECAAAVHAENERRAALHGN